MALEIKVPKGYRKAWNGSPLQFGPRNPDCKHSWFDSPEDGLRICTGCALEERYEPRKLTVLEWSRERFANTLRLAAEKHGAERDGWLEDAEYWRQIVLVLEAADTRRTDAEA